MIFVDQPLNVGYSYSDVKNLMVDNTADAAKHFVNFLYNFYKLYPHLKANPTYFFGESFGGHYIPAFARAVASNKSAFGDLNFKGVGIGDGWTMGELQTQHFNTYF